MVLPPVVKSSVTFRSIVLSPPSTAFPKSILSFLTEIPISIVYSVTSTISFVRKDEYTKIPESALILWTVKTPQRLALCFRLDHRAVIIKHLIDHRGLEFWITKLEVSTDPKGVPNRTNHHRFWSAFLNFRQSSRPNSSNSKDPKWLYILLIVVRRLRLKNLLFLRIVSQFK